MTIKGQPKVYKLQDYDISINPISEKQLSIQVIDTARKIQFSEQKLTLQKIGTSTLFVALQKKRKQISITSNYIKEGQFDFIQLVVKIESPFLKTIQEKIFVKKIRDIEDMQIIDMKLKLIGHKLRQIKQVEGANDGTVCSFEPKQDHFTGASYEPLQSIMLKKGKYMITFSFQVKATSQWLYLYLDQESIITNAGFYVPTTTYYMPFTVRIIKTIVQEEKTISFTTYSASSYPVFLKNRIITAQKLKE